MAQVVSGGIRNIAIVGHEGAGKTTLLEGFLQVAGKIKRMGSIKEKNTVSDFDAEEKESGKSSFCSTVSFPYNGVTINMLDVPGSSDSIGEAVSALRAVECAIVCVDASHGIKVNTRMIWQEAEKLGLPRIIAITRLDAENTDFQKTLAEVREHFGEACVPLFLPDGSSASFSKLQSTLHLADDASDEVKKINEQLVEAIVETDEGLMEKYLEGEEIAEKVLHDTFEKALFAGSIFPVIAVAAEKGIATSEVLDTVVEVAPPPELFLRKGFQGDEEVKINGDSGFVGYVYKTVSDEFVTRISYVRVLSGKLAVHGDFLNQRSGNSERVGNLLTMFGKEHSDITEVKAGDIFALTKIDDMRAGDTITDLKSAIKLEEVKFPIPMVSLAVKPKSRGDEQKIGHALKDLEGDDTTFNVHTDQQTGDLVICGMSDHHLQMMLKRLKRKRKVEVETSAPKIPYRETIGKSAKHVEYTHKKQSGGAGQFARVFIDMEPRGHGEGYVFEDKIVGGVIDGPLRPSVDKGMQAKMAEGVIAGYPVVDIHVRLVDGKTHPVDSKDIAFQIAGREVFKKAFLLCKPVLLEPVVKIEVTVPQSHMGDVMGDLNGRRGKIVSSGTDGPLAVVQAIVPQAELQAYEADLKSMTGGEGSYTIEFDHYEVTPPNIQKAIEEAHQKELADHTPAH